MLPEISLCEREKGKYEIIFRDPYFSGYPQDKYRRGMQAFVWGWYDDAARQVIFAHCRPALNQEHLYALAQERQGNLPEAMETLEKALATVRAVIPPDFKGELPWEYEGNQMFLRCLRALGWIYLEAGDPEKAMQIAKEHSGFNPTGLLSEGRGRGIWDLVAACHLAKRCYEPVLKMARHSYEAYMQFNGILASYLVYGDIPDFNLQNIVRAHPFVAREIYRTKHPWPHYDRDFDDILSNTSLEGYEYWRLFKKFWPREALAWFREEIESRRLDQVFKGIKDTGARAPFYSEWYMPSENVQNWVPVDIRRFLQRQY